MATNGCRLGEQGQALSHMSEKPEEPSKVSMQPWDWPEKQWSRIHVDHAAPILGKTLLIVVDAYSKWIEVHIVPSTTSLAAIEKLRVTFATHGLP